MHSLSNMMEIALCASDSPHCLEVVCAFPVYVGAGGGKVRVSSPAAPQLEFSNGLWTFLRISNWFMYHDMYIFFQTFS